MMVTAAAALTGGSAIAQGQPARFEVVSVRPADPEARGTTVRALPGGRFQAINISLRDLIASAYGTGQPLQRSRIVGGPDWMATARFNVEATAGTDAAGGAPPGDLFARLKSMLADRFQLKAKWETRNTPVYSLEKVNTDDRLGPGLRPVEARCSGAAAAKSAAAAAPRDGAPPPPPAKGGCVAKFSSGSISAQGMTLDGFLDTLGRYVDRIVVNATKDSREFDIDLVWTPDVGVQAGEPAPDPGRGSLFTAMRDQLGLKLEVREVPMEVLVVEHAERPSPN
jgi:uncharacterized protein (TIGR03435 family)